MFVVRFFVKHGKVHIGTSGWSYRDWPGLFYPEKMKPADWLSFYAESFNATEINSSFYHLPLAKTVLSWAEKVPPDFRFCPKISKYLTHIKRLKEPGEPLQRFFSVFGLIKAHLGPVLIQLPPSLKFEKEVAENLFLLLKSDYSDYEFALEARHQSWLEPDALTLLAAYNISLVLSQSGAGFPYAEVVTSGTMYVRFHGPGKLYFSSYSDEVLREFAEKFSRWLNKGMNTWVFFNNTGNGYGIENARTLGKLIKEK